MTFRRFFTTLGVLLILFLSMYSWNRQSHVIDRAMTNVGLETAGVILSPVRELWDAVTDTLDRYANLVDVKQKNTQLEARVRELETQILAHREDLAELTRLRDLLQLPADDSWKPVGARVIAGRLSPYSLLDSITINRGYASGARPGTPLVTHRGLIGRILRASPHTSTALLITNPGSRIAVFSQESRSAGVLTGEGSGRTLSVRYMPRETTAKVGEILVTSGLDGKYPKGIPVARILTIAPSNYTEFMTISAEPLVDMRHIEEVMLLEPTGIVRPPVPEASQGGLMGPPLPAFLQKKDDKKADRGRPQPAGQPGGQPNGQQNGQEPTAQ